MTLEASVRLTLGTLELEADLAVAAGTVLAVLGPNGAGKTTLLRSLAGLHRLYSGRVALDGVILELPEEGVFRAPEERRIGYLFQDYLLFPHLTVLENVAFGLQARGLPGALLQATAWLRRLGLEQYAGSRPAGLSGGQAQRVALARALAPGPRLLLLDEPLAALDASTRVAVRRDLRQHLGEFAGATVLVTHDPIDAAALADSVVVLEAGRIVQSGTIPEITARPRSRYVADLVGVNLWQGEADGSEVRVGDGAIAVTGEQRGAVFAMVHPHHVALYSSRPEGSPRNVWQAVVTSLDAFGDRVRVRTDGPLPLVAEITAAALAELGLAGGERVWVSFKASQVEVYAA